MPLLLLLLGLLTMVFVAGCVQVEVENDEDTASTKVIILTEGNNEAITSGGYYSISGELNGGQITVDTKEKVYIELAGVEITNSRGPALQIIDAKEITVILKTGTVNTMSDGGNSEYNAAIFSNDTLIIEGDGKLVVTGNNGHGIESDDDVIINGGDIIINGGLITAVCSDDGFNAETDITINGGTLTNTPLCIMEDDREALVFEAEKGYQSMVFSSPSLEKGKTYTILTGGTISGGSEFYGLYSEAIYSGGEESATVTIGADE